MRALRLLLVSLAVTSLTGLSACGLDSFVDPTDGGRPVSSLFDHSPQPRSHDDHSAALQPSAYTSENGTTPIIERGEADEARADQESSDPDLARQSVTLSFVDTDVREFAKVLFSQLLKRPYVIDPNISGTVTVRSGGNVDGNAAIVLARQALESAGSTITLSDGVYRVGTLASRGPDAGGNLQTFSLHYIDSTSARGALQPLIDGRAQIVGSTDSSITLRGDSESLALVSSMLETIDADRFQHASFGLFPLRNAAAADVVEQLRSLYASVGVTSETLLPIDRMNAILLVADRGDQLDFARKWISRLDQGPQNERQIYIYQVQHRKAQDLAELLQQIFTSAHVDVSLSAKAEVVPAESQADSVGAGPVTQSASVAAQPTVASGGIKITADQGSNTLVVWAKQSEYELIQRALQRLDTPLRQVYVEATIAEVRLNNELSHGVRWFLQSGGLGISTTDSNKGAFGESFPGFNFSLSVPEAQVVISALESHTNVRIVSSPELTVVDQQTATIQVGDQVPIITRTIDDTTAGASTVANDVELKDTGVILKVTPQIRSADEVLLDINQEVSTVEPTTSSQIDSPTISQRKIASTVLVPNGNAIVLGGLISSDDESNDGGLPGTQHTILQTLFGAHKGTAARSELIVIIRPVIIQNQGDMRGIIAEISSKMSNVMNVEVH